MPKRIKDRELIEDVRRVAARLHQRTLLILQYRKHGRFALSSFRLHFGSWKAVLRKAGLSTDHSADLPDAEILADIRRVARKMPGVSMTFPKYLKLGKFGRALIWRRFGSWTAARQQAGLGIWKPGRAFTQTEALADLRRVARLLRQSHVSLQEYARYGRFGRTTLRDRFGSWPEVLRRARLSTGHIKTNRVSKEDCLADIRRVARRCRTRTPTILQHKRYGRFTMSPVRRLFGSWKNAVKRAGLGGKRLAGRSAKRPR